MKQAIRSYIDTKFSNWLIRRVPSAREFELTNRNIFIFPTLAGFSYLLLVLLLFLLGTNYQNNVIMLISYLLASFFVTAMHASFFNMKGLVVESGSKASGFAGELIPISIQLTAKKGKHDITMLFKTHRATKIAKLFGVQTEDMVFESEKRGVYRPGRVKLESHHVFGLFRVWSWLDFGHEILVYPKPRPIAERFISSALHHGDHQQSPQLNKKDGDEFYELKAYVPGESQARVAWKHMARGQGKLSKHYVQQEGDIEALTLDMLPPGPLETRLEQLCYLILQYSQADKSFGISIPGVDIPVGKGQSHRDNCLTMLARYQGH
ncbi:DUF58 domain-containing protein [Thalassotalea euphylliae]|uniref:DUF58 domain-containing protein n=1 Tax=Thalassotalea euphylliae TaxID=1655234 RepID=UPI00363080A5